MPSPILARADALMHRRRQGLGESTELPVLTDAIGDDDIPVLLDVESKQAETTPLPAAQTAELSTPLPFAKAELREELARDLAARIEHRILAALPRLIDEAVNAALAELEARDQNKDAD